MKVNTSKTGMICISDSLNSRTAAFILYSEGQKIDSGDSLKVLGWHFLQRPTADAQIEVLKKQFWVGYWVLRHLKHRHRGPREGVLLHVETGGRLHV